MDDKRVLITGGRGVVGRAVVERLRRSGADILSVVHTAEALSRDEVRLDLAAPDLDLTAVVARPSAVVHLAAAVPNRSDRRNDEASADLTREIDRTLFQACETWDVPVVYASGCALYDSTSPELKTEAAEIGGATPYHAAKAEGDRLFQSLEHGCVARISSPYGPGLSPLSVLSKWLAKAAADETLEIWGTGDREQDFIHVDDIAHFALCAIERSVSGVFNVASGQPVTMRELAAEIVQAAARGTWTLSGDADPQDRSFARFDVSKARERLGWSAATPLEEGLRRLVGTKACR